MQWIIVIFTSKKNIRNRLVWEISTVHHFCDIEKLLFIYSKCLRCTNGAPLIALNFHSNSYFDSSLIEKNTSG